MNFKIIGAIFYKQIKDIAKNKTVLLQYFAFPVIAFVMSMVIPDDIMKEGIVTIFASMFVIMIPLLSISNVIAEENRCPYHADDVILVTGGSRGVTSK